MKFNQVIEEAEKNLKLQGFKTFLSQEYKQPRVLTIYTTLKNIENVLGPHEDVMDGGDLVWSWYINKDTNNPIEIYTDPPYRKEPTSRGKLEHVMNQKREFNLMGSSEDEAIAVGKLAELLWDEVEFKLWAPASIYTSQYLKMLHTKDNYHGPDRYSILGDDFQGVNQLVQFLKNVPSK